MMTDTTDHADHTRGTPAVQERAIVVSQRRLANDTWALRVACPQLAARIRPGQFFMVRLPGRSDPLLGRPFALYDTFDDDNGEIAGVEFVYHVIGKATGLLSQIGENDVLDLWGPLGNGFPEVGCNSLICVGGGIGYTPFLAVARAAAGQREYAHSVGRTSRPVSLTTGNANPPSISLLYGVRDRPHRADLADFDGIPGLAIELATDDGSEGHRGFVTELLERRLAASSGDASPVVFCCGPEPMMHATARICSRHNVPCWLSLETPMACGFGACFSCVTRVRTPEPPGWDYRRTCVEGPIFAAETLVME